ncbi:septal ring lytic transglycosylase RlpA family protein [Duganella sp. FT80W]|uniref:Endolytic peptidoglycan transglycosylase RlpA n=1 Tax=Duganella guangzhouensis TaxID=2666084 RepID=A0A6I2LAY4_9BURK|nr:septal ring lytic transglycosylase RlpA family protein [Duganella guangzhouensis]MRW93994.1 septal ring lytic transglycosylase RlpA family protein [Duganella guangzhouensis]
MRLRTKHLLKLSAIASALVLVGCGTAPVATQPTPRPAQTGTPSIKPPSGAKPDPSLPVLPPANSGRGGYYQDDGPGDSPPPNLMDTPDADVRNDPLLPRSNRPYTVFGKTYTPITDDEPFTQIGVGSWYGKKFHGQRTSSGELYDMYKMTAAHPILPIPSYARLTNMVSGASVVVRINDRGPFHSNRAIDVSYTAALKLGLLGKGSHELKIERILPEEVDRMLATREGVSGSTKPRLTPQPKDQLRATQPGAPTPTVTAKMVDTPLVLTPSAPVAAPATTQDAVSAPRDIESLMLADRAPAAYAAPNAPAAAGGFYLQLGAYARAENAEAVRTKLSGKLNGLEVVQGGAVFRLFGGPYASRQEAQQAAQGLPSSLGLKPIVVQR